MDAGKEPQAAIHIEETHQYKVVLGIVPIIQWQSGLGEIRVEVPYDGTVMNHNVPEGTTYPVGAVEISNAETYETESISINLPADESWQEKLKSNRLFEKTAEYNLEEPDQQLISIDGDVLEDLLGADIQSSDKIFGNIDSYKNPLVLQLNLWVPDLLTETRTDRLQQLEAMVQRGENSRQILMPGMSWASLEWRLAENLAALANSTGGRVLLGVEKNKRIVGLPPDIETRQQLLGVILRAALQCSPPVAIAMPTKIPYLPTGRHVYRIDVSQSSGRTHKVQDVIITRRGSVNLKKPASISEHERPGESELPDDDLEKVLGANENENALVRNWTDIIFLDAINGIKNIQLGAHICGLINAQKHHGYIKHNGYIIIKNINKSSRGFSFGFQQDLDRILEVEMANILPRLERPLIRRRIDGNQTIAIIQVPFFETPVALYKGQSYIWQNSALTETSIENIFEAYVNQTRKYGKKSEGQIVTLEQATINSPIRPPEALGEIDVFSSQEGLAYDIEYQARVWQSRPIEPDKANKIGHLLKLNAPLRHMSLSLDENGAAITKKAEVTGKIEISFQDVLISGLDANSEGNENNEWFSAIPVYKKTRLKLNYIAHLNELFRCRTKTSLMRFLIPDVLLDLERVNDLAQVFADTGFRIYYKEMRPIETDSLQKAIIMGISARGYYDIELLVGLLCHQTEVTRELRYEGWSDSKTTFTSEFDIRIFLSGTGTGVETEIDRLQVELYQTISQRFQHLRVE